MRFGGPKSNAKLFTGKFETIGGVQCYVGTPTGDFPKDKVLLFLTDAFGIELVNSKVRRRSR
jgi:hypothetical protein